MNCSYSNIALPSSRGVRHDEQVVATPCSIAYPTSDQRLAPSAVEGPASSDQQPAASSQQPAKANALLSLSSKIFNSLRNFYAPECNVASRAFLLQQNKIGGVL